MTPLFTRHPSYQQLVALAKIAREPTPPSPDRTVQLAGAYARNILDALLDRGLLRFDAEADAFLLTPTGRQIARELLGPLPSLEG